MSPWCHLLSLASSHSISHFFFTSEVHLLYWYLFVVCTHVQAYHLIFLKRQPESLTLYQFSAVYSFFQISWKGVLLLLISSSSFQWLNSLHCSFHLLFQLIQIVSWGSMTSMLPYSKDTFFPLTLLEIFAAFNAVGHFFLLESLSSCGFLPWHHSLLILLTVCSRLSSEPSIPLLAPQMLASPEFSPQCFSLCTLYAYPGNEWEQACIGRGLQKSLPALTSDLWIPLHIICRKILLLRDFSKC